jgi:[Skp1-protein]-hydroxyproline N-acetylglucosaminyltransferase
MHKPVAVGLTVLIILYTTITLATYHRVVSIETNAQRQTASSNTGMSSTASGTRQFHSNHHSGMMKGADQDDEFVKLLPTLKAMVRNDQELDDAMSEKRNKHHVAYTAIEQLQHTFPIHVNNDTVVIPHPGLALSDNEMAIKKAGLDNSRSLTVPRFFDHSHGHIYSDDDNQNASIRDYLGNGKRLMTPSEAAQIGSYVKRADTTKHADNDNDTDNESGDGYKDYSDSNDMLHTIYASIASYRDPECTATVEDLYHTAKHPERIRVAIIDQRVPGDNVCSQPAVPCEQDPNQALCRYRHLIDVYHMDARLAIGPVFARHLAQRHYRGEYFAMQLDSHVRMTADWDTDIITQWESAHNEMAVLSTYVSDLNGRINPKTHERNAGGRPIMCVAEFEGRGSTRHLRFGQQPEGMAGIHGQPTIHPFWAAGFSFARGHYVIQVPYDQYLPMIFQGEEISMTLRGYSYGYDYYAPEYGVCFHMYAVKENRARREKIPLFWENVETYRGAALQGMKRLNSIIGLIDYPVDQWPQEDKELYGLGQIRDTAKFFKTFGIHTNNSTLEPHLCKFVGKPMMRVFLPALRENRMGLDWSKIDYTFVDPDPEEKTKFLRKPVAPTTKHAAKHIKRTETMNEARHNVMLGREIK